MRPRQWIKPITTLRPNRVANGRNSLERRALAARRETQVWVTSGSNAARVGAYLARCGYVPSRSLPSHGRPLADDAVLLEEWGVPGIAAPSDLSDVEAARWSRSLTLVVLRHLRRQGHLQPVMTDHTGPRARPARAPGHPRGAEHQGHSPHAGASPAPTKVAPMAGLPKPPPALDPEPTRFRPVDVRVDGGNLSRRRLDAQAAVDLAREQSILARHALLSGPAGADEGPARAAADDASTVLRAAVGALTALTALDDGDGTGGAELDVTIVVDGGRTVARPRGELDLYTSPRLEQVCVAQLDGGDVELLVVDLSEVTFLDSSALAVLVEIRRVCLLGTTRFAISAVTPRTRRLLEITRLDTVLDVL